MARGRHLGPGSSVGPGLGGLGDDEVGGAVSQLAVPGFVPALYPGGAFDLVVIFPTRSPCVYGREIVSSSSTASGSRVSTGKGIERVSLC